MPQRILGIDMGSWSVKAVLVDSSFRGSKVEAVQEVVLAPGEPDTLRERQVNALRELMSDPQLRADTQVAALPGELTTLRFIELPFADSKKIDAVIGGELADTLPFDLGDAVSDHSMLQKLEGGRSLSLCAATQRVHIKKHLERLSAGSADPRFVPVDVLQLFNLYSHFLKQDASKPEAPGHASPDAGTFVQPEPGGPPDARLVVDIGHERTLVCAASELGVGHARVIRAGGRDVTDAIAKAYQIAPADAEIGKQEDAVVASSRHPAPSDAAQRMSEVVAEGLQPLVRELRRTIQSIRKEKRVRVARIDLLGGGSRIRNLANYLAEQLNVPVANGVAVEQVVERHVDASRRAAYAVALASALRPSAEAPVSRLELRRGEFMYAGQLQNLRHRVPLIAGAVALLTFLMGVNLAVQYQAVSSREAQIDAQFCKITKDVVGREICEPSVALSVLREPPSELGSFKMPERSAFMIAAALSHHVPKDLDLTLDEMDITPDRARVNGKVASFDAVDQLVTAYAADPCFKDIKKGKILKAGDGQTVEFPLTIQLGCSQ